MKQFSTMTDGELTRFLHTSANADEDANAEAANRFAEIPTRVAALRTQLLPAEEALDKLEDDWGDDACSLQDIRVALKAVRAVLECL